MADRARRRGPRRLPEHEEESCHYCGVEFKKARRSRTVDHIVPSAVGGLDLRWNYVASCRDCNAKKGSEWPTCKCNKCRKSVKLHWQMRGIRPPK